MPTRFGTFVLDAESHELKRDDVLLHLSPKAFRLLELLVERRPAVLSKQQLLDQIWEGQIVEEENIKNLVAELRRTLGDAEDVIRTVHRVGYAFSGEAVELPRARAVSSWRLSDGTRSYLVASCSLIGRGSECDIRLEVESVSRVHARILLTGPAPTIEDLGSKNGTHVAGQRIAGPTKLADGDVIRIGSVSLVLHSENRLETRTLPPY